MVICLHMERPLEYTICAQRVVGSNLRKVNGGGRKVILSFNEVCLLTREQIP